MKNTYEYFDSVSDFGCQPLDKFAGLTSYYCYIKSLSLDRVYRVEIKRDNCSYEWYVAKIYYRGSRDYIQSVSRMSVRDCVERVFELLQ